VDFLWRFSDNFSAIYPPPGLNAAHAFPLPVGGNHPLPPHMGKESASPHIHSLYYDYY
jgi:hypothetical protein